MAKKNVSVEVEGMRGLIKVTHNFDDMVNNVWWICSRSCICNFRERVRRVEKKAANVKPKFRLSSTTAAFLNGIILGMLIFLDNDKTL